MVTRFFLNQFPILRGKKSKGQTPRVFCGSHIFFWGRNFSTSFVSNQHSSALYFLCAIQTSFNRVSAEGKNEHHICCGFFLAPKNAQKFSELYFLFGFFFLRLFYWCIFQYLEFNLRLCARYLKDNCACSRFWTSEQTPSVRSGIVVFWLMFELRRLSDHLTSLTDMALRGKLCFCVLHFPRWVAMGGGNLFEDS